MHLMRTAPKVMPPVCPQELDTGGKAAKAELSHQFSTTFCFHTTGSRLSSALAQGLLEAVQQLHGPTQTALRCLRRCPL